MKKHYRKENDCLNCGTILEGKYCHNCGQENLQMKESFGHMMNHAISDYFHFDDQFFHTIKPLFFKPGFLSLEYLGGRRARYLHPVKMYIFISLVYFVLLFQPGFHPTDPHNTDGKKDAKKSILTTNKQLDSVIKDQKVPVYVKNAMINSKKLHTTKADTIHDDSNKPVYKKYRWLNATTTDTSYAQYSTSQQKMAANKRDGLLLNYYNRKVFEYNEKYGSMAKEIFFDEFKHNIPKMMFLMLPLCALIFQIAFWSNKKYYVENLIYTFHLHCFLFLFLIIVMLLQRAIPTSWNLNFWLLFVATSCIIWYLYRSLRVFYHRSRFRTITKLMGATFMYFFVFTFCFLIVFLITAITM
ncbi:MAG: DUF3667 domain-containing protein [Sphingobacteriales bacterium]